MEINVLVKPNAKYSQVIKLTKYDYKVSVDAPTKDNEANNRLIEILAEHFEVPRSFISIVRGFKSKKKVIRVG
ncbi:MAG: DUF167 domain-containing protein [Candidatus Aenigmatarchaeota archaeon]